VTLTRPHLRVVLLVAVLVALGFSLTVHPLDLAVYRFGGRSILDGTPLYAGTDPATGYPFTYPPAAALLFVPVSLLPGTVATFLWTAASVIALAAVLVIFLRAERQELSALRLGTVLVLGVALYPVRETLFFGQVNVLLMAAVCLDLLVLRGRLSGVLVGLAAGIKLTPLVFIVLLVLVGRRVAAFRAMAVFTLTVGLGFVLVPSAAAEYWTRAVWDSGRVGGLEYVRNQSVNGTLTRLLGQEPSTLLWVAVAGPLAAAVLVLAAVVWRRGDPAVSILLAAGSMLLASPVSWDHHWVWGAPALVVLLRRAHPLLAALWVLLLGVGLRFVVTSGEGRELSWTWWQHVIGNSYVWALVLSAFVVAAQLRAGSTRPATSPSVSRPPSMLGAE
jgi:alpha-1,2-mannosyltransferase